MFDLIQHHGITLAVCVAIGAVTAWWVFRRGKERNKP